MPVKKPPKYRLQKSRGLAAVRLNGRDYYLGEYGSDASWEAYHRLLQQWYANGCRPLLERSVGHGLRSEVSDAAGLQETIVELLNDYWDWACSYYRKNGEPTGTLDGVKVAVNQLAKTFGRIGVNDFGPLALKQLREDLIHRGLSRRYINDHTQRLKAIFKWAVAEERCLAETYQRLLAVRGLSRGRSHAKETEPVRPVEVSVVERTLPHLSRVVADMISVQLLCGCRPGEVVLMRPKDIEKTGSCWIYRPHRHKTEHHGKSREIVLGPKCQAVLQPYLDRAENAYCFSPAEALESHRSVKHYRRDARRRPRERYDTASFNRAIRRACDRAGIPPWTPNQLRHTAATRIREQYGLEAAQVVLGHSSADVTQIYAEVNRNRAVEVVMNIG